MHFDFTGHLIGNLTRDPELRFAGDDAVCNFGIAINHQRKSRDGDGYEDVGTTFAEITCWRGLAEHVAESYTKGDRVIAVGTMVTRDWEDKEGNIRSTLEMTADDCGPSLLWATAVPEKAAPSGGGGGRSSRASSRSSSPRGGAAQRSGRAGATRSSGRRPVPDGEEPF